jgi:hypothetical protein
MRWSRGLCILIVLSLPASFAAPAGAESLTRVLTYREKDLTFDTRDGYDRIGLAGARWTGEPGHPQLPAVPVRIGLPGRARVQEVRAVTGGDFVVGDDYRIWPAQVPVRLGETPRFVPPGEEVYGSGELYPAVGARYVGSGTIDGATVCDVMLYPLRWSPVSGRLILHRRIEVEVFYSRTGTAPGDRPSALGDLVGSLVENPGLECVRRRVSDVRRLALSGDDVDYLIITGDALVSAFEPLADWKRKKGLPAAVVTTGNVASGYTGSDLQEKIRNCIIDHHDNYGTTWVLLGGDVDVVPDRKAYVPLSDKPYIPCDLYYSDLDGNWNEDGDLYWGEHPADGVDMYADVYVGRAPVSSLSEAEDFVAKVLTYEGIGDLKRDYQTDFLFAGEVLWGDPEDPEGPDYTDAGVAKDLVDSLYVAPGFDVEKLYESEGGLDRAALVAGLESGKGIINILCHGQYTSISTGNDEREQGAVSALGNGPRYGLC